MHITSRITVILLSCTGMLAFLYACALQPSSTNNANRVKDTDTGSAVYVSPPVTLESDESVVPEKTADAAEEEQSPLLVLLQNELQMRRNPENLDLKDCEASARKNRAFDLARLCLGYANNQRNYTSGLSLSALMVELQPENPRAHMAHAQSHINNENYVTSLEVLSKATQQGLDVDLALPAVRSVFLYGDDMTDLLGSYKSLRTQHPDNVRLLLGEAVLLTRRMEQAFYIGRYNEVLQSTETLLDLRTQTQHDISGFGFETVYLTRARALVELEQPKKAIRTLEGAIADNDGYIQAALELVGLYLQTSRYADAERLCTEILGNHQQDVLYSRIGLLIANAPLNQSKSIVHQYFTRKADSKDLQIGEREFALWYLSEIAREGGDSKTQVGYLERITQTESLLVASIRIRAELLEQDEGFDSANNFFIEQIRTNSHLASNISLTHAYWLSEHDRGQAIDLVNTLLAQQGPTIDLLYARGFFYALDGNIVNMEKDFDFILRNDPLHVDTLNAYGYTLVDMTERVEQGLAMINQAFSLNSERPAIVDSLAWAYFRKGEQRRALVLIQWAYSRDQDPEIGAHYGEILWTLGYTTEAKALLSRDRKYHPEHEILNETWERLFGDIQTSGTNSTQ